MDSREMLGAWGGGFLGWGGHLRRLTDLKFKASGDAESPGLADLVGPSLDHHVLINPAGGRSLEGSATDDGFLGLIEQVPNEDGFELLGHVARLVG